MTRGVIWVFTGWLLVAPVSVRAAAAQLRIAPQATTGTETQVEADVITVNIQMRDGSRLSGDLVGRNQDSLIVRTPAGSVRVIPTAEIRRIAVVGRGRGAGASPATAGSHDGPLKKGETRLGLFPLVQAGVTDNVSIAVAPLLLPNGQAALFLNANFLVWDGAGNRLSAGIVHSEWFDRGRVGLAYVSATRRADRYSLTAGALAPYARTRSMNGNLYLLRLGGSRQIGGRFHVQADAMGSTTGVVIATTVGPVTNGVSWRAGVMMSVRGGQVRRVLPVFNLGFRL